MAEPRRRNPLRPSLLVAECSSSHLPGRRSDLAGTFTDARPPTLGHHNDGNKYDEQDEDEDDNDTENMDGTDGTEDMGDWTAGAYANVSFVALEIKLEAARRGLKFPAVLITYDLSYYYYYTYDYLTFFLVMSNRAPNSVFDTIA